MQNSEEKRFAGKGNFIRRLFAPLPEASGSISSHNSVQWNLPPVPMQCKITSPPFPQCKTAVDGRQFLAFFTKAYGFSNHHPAQFRFDGEIFCCVEQYYMYEKTLYFGYNRTADEIMETTDPGIIKRLGRADTLHTRRVKGWEPSAREFDHREWQAVKEKVMLNALYAKFEQNLWLQRMLVDTGHAMLVEASPSDCYWGIGCGIDSPDIEDTRKWRGDNRLGFLLMQVRQTLQNGHDPHAANMNNDQDNGFSELAQPINNAQHDHIAVVEELDKIEDKKDTIDDGTTDDDQHNAIAEKVDTIDDGTTDDDQHNAIGQEPPQNWDAMDAGWGDDHDYRERSNILPRPPKYFSREEILVDLYRQMQQGFRKQGYSYMYSFRIFPLRNNAKVPEMIAWVREQVERMAGTYYADYLVEKVDQWRIREGTNQKAAVDFFGSSLYVAAFDEHIIADLYGFLLDCKCWPDQWGDLIFEGKVMKLTTCEQSSWIRS